MSHFVCGKISFAVSPWEGEEAFLFDLQRAAIDARINLQVGWAICQPKIPSDITGALSPNDLPFLMTDSPVWDVAEQLIAPDVFVHGEEKCRAIVQDSLGRIRDVVAKALTNDKVLSVTVAVSDGVTIYDDYEKLVATVDDFVKVVIGRFVDMANTPDLHVLVRRK